MIQKTNRWLYAKPYPIQLLIFVIAASIPKLLILPLLLFIEAEGLTITKQIPDFTTAIIIAPLLEAFTFVIPFWLMSKVPAIKTRPIIIILTSSIIFSMLHVGFTTMLNAFFIGLVFSYIYYFYYHKQQYQKAYWSNVLIHSIFNLITYGAYAALMAKGVYIIMN